MKLDHEDLAKLLELLNKNDVTEFKLEREKEKLWLRRGPAEGPTVVNYGAIPQYSQPIPQVLPVVAPAATTTSVTTAAAAVPVSEPAPALSDRSNLKEVKSPMVGTFYRRPAVDADPYVEVGDIVKKGDVVCIVEAMKLMNEIQTDVAGKIVEISVEDGQMAEYGEVLFRIEPMSH